MEYLIQRVRMILSRKKLRRFLTMVVNKVELCGVNTSSSHFSGKRRRRSFFAGFVRGTSWRGKNTSKGKSSAGA